MSGPLDDIGAFEQICRELHAALGEVVDSYVQSQSIAEEIVQDLMFTVWLRRRTPMTGSLRAYLFAAARALPSRLAVVMRMP